MRGRVNILLSGWRYDEFWDYESYWRSTCTEKSRYPIGMALLAVVVRKAGHRVPS